MKKILALLLAIVMVFSLAACGSGETTESGESIYKVAMITDYGEITDQSFNQTTWEAVTKFGTDYSIDTKYYRPTSNDLAARVAAVDLAVAEGYNVIVLPGFAHGSTIAEVSEQYPDVKFIALDVAAGDILETAVANKGESYDYNPDNWNLTDYVYMDNVYCAIYQEQLAGYMAGYAIVKLGYTEIGYLGGMAVGSVMRYGYGFVQGVNDAAAEMGVTAEVNYSWLHGASFSASPELQTMATGWYQTGTEIIFACGGSMFTSVDAAASAEECKVVGVDVDQSYQSANVVTSAMKGLADATAWAIAKHYEGAFSEIGGTATSLGAKDNAVGLPTATWSLENWSVEEYETLFAAIVAGEVEISAELVEFPESTDNVTVTPVK